jgi:hypothetical protein
MRSYRPISATGEADLSIDKGRETLLFLWQREEDEK